MKIIGVGCGPGMLTEQAIREISKAEIIYGSDRAIDLAQSCIPVGCVVKTIDDFKQLKNLPDNVVILSTGDPMLAGLGYLPGEVICGISSFQLATARLKIPVSRVSVVVAHGKGHEKGMQDTVDRSEDGKDRLFTRGSEIRRTGSVQQACSTPDSPEDCTLRKSGISS